MRFGQHQHQTSKLLEKIVCLQLVAHLEDNNLLYEHQYGFQHDKSTEHNLIQLTNFLNSARNEKKYAIGIFLDLKIVPRVTGSGESLQTDQLV